MFRCYGINGAGDAIQGLLESDAWRADEAASALRSLAHDDAMFIIDELLGWHADLVGVDPNVESAVSRLMGAAMRGDFGVVAAAIKRAIRARRAVEQALANDD